MLICEMNSEQVSAVAAISASCFSVPWSEQAVKNELANNNSRTLVAVDDGKVVGFINAHYILDEVYINNIAVFEDKRGTGIGSKLLLELILIAKAAKSSFITLEVRESNYKAIRFYESFNFALQGIRKNFYTKPVENARIYTLHDVK